MNTVVNKVTFDTSLGTMIAIADEDKLYLLEFLERKGLDKEIGQLKKQLNVSIVPGYTKILKDVEQEMKAYLTEPLKNFKTSFLLSGSDFQNKVWKELQNIPYGQTCSYLDVAKKIGNPKAVRAVANAIGANKIVIMVPCHRVINTGGRLGGYSSGLRRKQWLLKHEDQSEIKEKAL